MAMRSWVLLFPALHLPEHGKGDALIHQRKHQDVDVDAAQFPIGSIQRQNPGPLLPDQRYHQPGNRGKIQFEIGQKAPDALVRGLGLDGSGKNTGDLGQTDGLNRDDRHQKSGQELDSCPIPVYTLRELVLDLLDGAGLGASFSRHRGASGEGFV